MEKVLNVIITLRLSSRLSHRCQKEKGFVQWMEMHFAFGKHSFGGTHQLWEDTTKTKIYLFCLSAWWKSFCLNRAIKLWFCSNEFIIKATFLLHKTSFVHYLSLLSWSWISVMFDLIKKKCRNIVDYAYLISLPFQPLETKVFVFVLLSQTSWKHNWISHCIEH